MNKPILIKLCSLLFVLALTSEVLEAKMYRYKNAEGKTVVSSTLPPEYSQNGYEVCMEYYDATAYRREILIDLQ